MSKPDSPNGSGDDFLTNIFSNSHDSGDSDSDNDRQPYTELDYDAQFWPLEHLDLAQVQDPSPGAELCYALEDFGPDNMKSCVSQISSSPRSLQSSMAANLSISSEFKEFFWWSFFHCFLSDMILSEVVIKVHNMGKLGVISTFNTEGQLERKARENKEANNNVCHMPVSFPPFCCGLGEVVGLPWRRTSSSSQNWCWLGVW